ncbi:translation initiation factor IF-2-like [Penaeus chinensis]|uniref:translation initiation factor IF-2-like n=1 Tax=Penaeus chinensis TaxID=139456 RepID=UPI001FB7A294|nr:translation initiation factor IF-2-like [Penaeus chinensis]
MKPLIPFFALAAVALAAPQGYSNPVPAGGGVPLPAVAAAPVIDAGAAIPVSCLDGEVLNVDGTCSVPQITRHVYVFAAPDQPAPQGPPPSIPPPQVEHNVIFIRAPEQADAAEPIVVPPPQQQSVIYVLNKRQPTVGGRPVIEVPAPPPSNPEVFFVNYGPNENPVLPGGIDLQSALSSAAPSTGQLIGGGGAGGFDAGVGAGPVGGFDAGFAAGPAGGFDAGVGPAGGFGGGVVASPGPGVGVPLSSAVSAGSAGLPGPQLGLDNLANDYTPNAVEPPLGLYSAP